MRARTGCQACRERHIKCVRENASDECQKCLEHNRACFQTARHRFRPVTSVNFKTEDDRTIKHNLVYDVSQKWVDIPSQVEFVDHDNEDTSANQQARPGSSRATREPAITEDIRAETDYASEREQDQHGQLLSFPSVGEVNAGLEPNTNLSDIQQYSTEQVSAHIEYKSPSQVSKRSRSDFLQSPSFVSTSSPLLAYPTTWPCETQHEARLFHYYIKVMAPWIDATDAFAHFGKEVPRRVPHFPMIASAIYALASRHMSMVANVEDDESPRYADKCLQVLIKSMDDPFAHWDENLLAAVVILRLHEELSHDDDLRCHLFGTRKILDSVSAFAADGGLREAASWVSLRQHIYVSLTEQQPLDINLQNFRHSSVFIDGSTRNEDWANRIVFIFATILDYAFAPSQTPAPARWHELSGEVENWYNTKPWDFAPLWKNMNPSPKMIVSTPASVPGTATTPKDTPSFYLTRSTSLSGYPLKPWPELIMAHRAQVTALQYYHLARVILAIYDPELTRLGFGSLRARKSSERVVLDGVRNIVGLAVSNEDVNNAIFEASHILKTCGGYLKDEAEQNAAVAFLENIQQRMGWTTGKTIAELRSQWAAQ